jgi:hypothetical protein
MFRNAAEGPARAGLEDRALDMRRQYTAGTLDNKHYFA